MSCLRIRNAHIVDPTHPGHGQTTDLWIRDGHFANEVSEGTVVEEVDVAGALVLAGGIDLHTHIGGGKVNIARMLSQQIRRDGRAICWPTIETGQLYNAIGYTTCFEPAMLLSSARHTHLELADTPNIDSGAYVVMGNDDWLLRALGNAPEPDSIDALVAWTVQASAAKAVKCVNPGGISAFKFDGRMLELDAKHPKFGTTPRDVIRQLTASIDRLGLSHPLHLHASNLGVPGNVATTLDSLNASEGRRIHLTHAQFNCYGDGGPKGMNSGAEQLAKYINEHTEVSLDIGQVVFGQTITLSADLAAQYRNRDHAHPKQWLVNQQDCQAGCGAVPIKYEDTNYVHSLQWTIGLELMLLVNDPWRIFLTTDHPNGGPFTCYPHLMRLLMDRTYRLEMLDRIHPLAREHSLLREIEREYTLDEIAITTRCAPAKILGLKDRGSLREGCVADLAVYTSRSNWESTFSHPSLVYKSGQLVNRDGTPQDHPTAGKVLTENVEFDSRALAGHLPNIEQLLGRKADSLVISLDELNTQLRVA